MDNGNKKKDGPELSAEMLAFVEPIITACKGQFPRKCNNCGREFRDFPDFVSGTRPIGAPQAPSASRVDDPFGVITYVNCVCGSTIILQCTDPGRHAMLVEAVREEAERTGRPPKEILLTLRAEVRRRMGGE